ncbi:BspA family leucine-rich repeat surface protein [Mycoplasma cottewii]|uniref:BspA family leucine-rich repeat surface protein n=1 Tax=Mycoplasma cottewii TaxID=51364 RepID=A0ABY5TX99_9MOLU|nr:BspA family leucine-rich repeat surface protein [Mycoplasma cottewii]UWD34621.1 BspA family leucine-rich repeat surface protein [Mycoplasma cottewii]
MKKKTWTILLSTLGGLSIAGAVGGVVAYKKMMNKVPFFERELTREHLEYVNKIIRENNLSPDLFKLDSDGGIELKSVFTIQKSEYINDEQGRPIECTKIGYTLTTTKEIRIERMPKTVKKVPSVLPKEISSLSRAFENNINTEIDGIQHWDTSNITNMTDMFNGAKNFNQDISNWDTSKVIRMYAMFQEAKLFNQDLSNWDVSKVKGFAGFNEDAHPEFTGDKLPKFIIKIK